LRWRSRVADSRCLYVRSAAYDHDIGRVAGSLCVLVALGFGAVSGTAGAAPLHRAAGRVQPPSWSLQAAQVVAGQPFSVGLDPRDARVCWVSVSGPPGFTAVGWKFDVDGHQLNLTLLTQSNAAPGPWSLSASCRRASHSMAASKMSIQIVSGGTGALVSHGDMRVEVVASTR
jgi:hypothetical protein